MVPDFASDRTLVCASQVLRRAVSRLSYAPAAVHMYNPLDYAQAAHEQYLRRFAGFRKEVLLVGMNPGPWGMAQTGVPFGEVSFVRDWMGINAEIKRPKRFHPRVPITGFACKRSEVSGRRLWGWARERFGTAESFFSRYFVANYCPLMFLDAQGRNVTPDKLPVAQRQPLLKICDRALAELIAALDPRFVIGIGGFAESRVRAVADGSNRAIGGILHPSPASPTANRGWAIRAEAQLRALGVDLD